MARTETLYHYCSSEAFLSIIKSKKIRLSALSLSNDSSEGTHVVRIFEELAEADGLTEPIRDSIIKTIRKLQACSRQLGFCLSEEGNRLALWERYADKGAGVSIGFSEPGLNPPFGEYYGTELKQVIYNPAKQKKLLKDYYLKIVKNIRNGESHRSRAQSSISDPQQVASENESWGKCMRDAFLCIAMLQLELYKIKSPDFKDECEWRLITEFPSGNKRLENGFTERHGLIRPYATISIPLSGDSCRPFAINEVILGPRNRTPNWVVEQFLKQNGFGEPKVSKSMIPYQ